MAAPHVEAVLCGHVHWAMFRRWADTVVAACLLHLWDPAQGLVSHTSHIGTYPGPHPCF